jgi:hypothetical protein
MFPHLPPKLCVFIIHERGCKLVPLVIHFFKILPLVYYIWTHLTDFIYQMMMMMMMIIHWRNNITCSTNCKSRTAATRCTLETWFFFFRYIIVNTLHKGDNKGNNNITNVYQEKERHIYHNLQVQNSCNVICPVSMVCLRYITANT